MDGRPSLVNRYIKVWTDDKGRRHRDNDLPAVICYDGTKLWYRHGKNHRDNNKPAKKFANGRWCQWWIDGAQQK